MVSIRFNVVAITGTSVNPARSLGPAVIVGGTALSQLWLFWVAPIIGDFWPLLSGGSSNKNKLVCLGLPTVLRVLSELPQSAALHRLS